MPRKLLIAALIAAQLTSGAFAASQDVPAAVGGKGPTVVRIEPGKTVKVDGFELVLNEVVQPGADAIGGEGFTEYSLTVSNRSADKELVIANATLSVRGDSRHVVRDYDDIVNQGNTSGKAAATTAGATAAGFIGGMFGVVGTAVSMIGVNAAASKIYVDDPQKWREELKKRGFQGNDAGVSIYPSESVTGSIWFKQSSAEVADRMQLYVKQGGASRVVRLDLSGMPKAVVAAAKE